jgi:uncharacterized protein YbgA (DUF1722 family)/uncharacterized protein YbbK (DUF523 family)
MKERINLGISTCLVGEHVRYDGGHKLNHYLKDVVGQFVNWISVCPEVECGLCVPREAMRLVEGQQTGDYQARGQRARDHQAGNQQGRGQQAGDYQARFPQAGNQQEGTRQAGEQQLPHLVTIKTGIDYTEQMLTWSEKKLEMLEKLDLCGFVFKSKSPSSGMKDVKIYSSSGIPIKKGAGIFARQFMERFPLTPVEDDGRLNDAALRENFIERVFVFKRWKDLVRSNFSLEGLISFHTNHKLLIMSHSVKQLSELGKIVAQAKTDDLKKVFDHYISILMTALKLKATVKKNVNVLQHIMGYFKKMLSPAEKQELLEAIENYHNGSVPLIVPVVLLNHYVRKFDEPYLRRQYYLNPHPIERILKDALQNNLTNYTEQCMREKHFMA